MIFRDYCAAIVVCAMALAGCSEADRSLGLDEVDEEVVITASLPIEKTRTTFSYNDDSTVMKVAWAAGDVIYAVSNGKKAAFTQKGNISADGKTAYFSKTSGSLSKSKSVIFGYTADDEAYPGTNSTTGTYAITSQTGALNDMKYYDVLTCCTKVGSDGSVPAINFVRQVAWLKLSDVSFDGGETGVVSNIYLTGADFHNFIYVNANNGASTTRSTATITVTPTGSVKIADGKLTKDIYIAFFPDAGAQQGDEGTVTLMTAEGNAYQLKWQSSSAYMAGNMYVLKGKMDKISEFSIQFKDSNVKNILTKKLFKF